MSTMHSPPGTALRRAWLYSSCIPLVVLGACGTLLPVTLPITAASACLIAWLCIGAVTDARLHVIRNWVTYPAICWGLVLNLCCAEWEVTSESPSLFTGLIGGSSSLGGFLLGFSLMYVVYRLNQGGAGDVKMAAAIGAWMGPASALSTLLFAHIIAAAYGVASITWRIGARQAARTLMAWACGIQGHPSCSQAARDCRIPLAPFLLCGVIITWCEIA